MMTGQWDGTCAITWAGDLTGIFKVTVTSEAEMMLVLRNLIMDQVLAELSA